MSLSIATARKTGILGAALLTSCTLAACAPMYETQYTFFPPETDRGQSCIFQCENSKSQCEQLEDMRYDRCDERAQSEYDRCVWRNGEKDCYKSYCSSKDYDRCEGNYRTCYQSCGGKVESKQVCVAFCEQGKQ